MTQVWEYIKIALMNIRSNKGRSILTMLGIIIGVTAVIVIVGLGNGMTQSIKDSFSDMGTDLLSVQVMGYGARSVSVDSVYDIVESHPDIFESVSPTGSVSGTVKVGTDSYSNTTVKGVSEVYFDMLGYTIDEGRLLNYVDLENNKKVCVVGFTSDTKEEAELLRTMGCEVEMFTGRTAKYAVLGQERVTALSVNGEEHPCEAVFILRPAAAPDSLLAGLAMDGVHVAVDKATMKTSVAGVFAAGDCTGKPYQIAKAVGDGNIAALSAAQYIEERSREKKA